MEVDGLDVGGAATDMFQLVENYRTHIRIVKLAHSIVTVLTYFFPTLIDPLQPETSRVNGDMPIFLTGLDPFDSLSRGMLQASNGPAGAICAFGAEQAVLVRDEVTKLKLKKQYGEAMLVLTVHEAKGLEFTTILVYDFFSTGDPSLGTTWRLIYRMMIEVRLEDAFATR